MSLKSRIVLLAVCLAASLCACPQSVVFINPGKSDEAYWTTVSSAMHAAARDLGMKLEVLYAERDHQRQVALAHEVAERPAGRRPNFAVLVNERATGPEMLRILDAAGVKTFFAFSNISPEERGIAGVPREKYKGWIGSLEPHAEDAGYLTGKALIALGRKTNARAPDRKLHLIVIAGDRTTTSSVLRNEGLMKAVAESPDVTIDQTVYAGWARDKAAEQADWLYSRYPDARLVWAGNDLMAFGAIQALEKRGGVPGKDAYFSGVNTSKEAMDALRSGRLTALAGGHFIAGAWSLVMIYDYSHGRDFRDEGLELDRPMFVNFDAASAAVFEERFGQGFDKVGFARYSKALNPSVKRYDFGFGQLLR